MSKQNFYVTGGNMPRDARSYVERRADNALYESLGEGKFCYVLDSRQIGKSSLMARISARLAESGLCVVTLDLQAIGQNVTVEQWYYGLLKQIGQQPQIEDELEEFWLHRPLLGPLQRWMSAITEVVLPRCPGRLVIFVDEIDLVRSLPFKADEFFAGIREFHNRRTTEPELETLTFCLLGAATPSDLIKDVRTTPFNIGHRVELYDFTEEEAKPLAQGLGRAEKIGNKLLKRILYWTNGHPYLTQLLCQSVAEDATVKGSRGVDRLCEELFFTPQARKDDHNLQHVSPRILKGNKGETKGDADLASLLDLYKRILGRKRVKDDNTNPQISELQLSGIIRVNNGSLRVRNRIYERVFGIEWVKENMPGAELRRQRAAYNRGLLRATAVVVTIICLAIAAISLWNRADEQVRVSRRHLYATEMKVAKQAWDAGDISLMQELVENNRPAPGQEDLRGFEWYYLWRLYHRDLHTLRHTSACLSVAFSPDKKRLAVGTDDGAVKLWDTVTRQEVLTLKEFSRPVNSVAFSPDGKNLASGDDDTIKLWDAFTGQELLRFNGHGKVYSLAFSPDGEKLAAGSSVGSVKLWEVATGKELSTLSGGNDNVYAVVFSPNGKMLASAVGNVVRLWDIISGNELLALGGRWHTGSVAFSPDGKTLAAAVGSYGVYLWSVATGKLLRQFKIYYSDQIMFSPDGNRLASRNNGSTVSLWDVATGKELLTLKGHQGNVSAIAFSPDGQILASGSYDHTVKLWDVNIETLGRSYVFNSRLITPIWTPHIKLGADSIYISQKLAPLVGKTLASNDRNWNVSLWEVSIGQEPLSMQTKMSKEGKEGKEDTWGPAISPNGERLAYGSYDHTVKVWDIRARRELLTLKSHSGNVICLAFSPDGKRLASGSKDNSVVIWDVDTGRKLVELRGHFESVLHLTFSIDGRRLVSVSGDTGDQLKLWDTQTGKEMLTLDMERDSFNISSDWKNIAWADEEGTVKLLDIDTGQETPLRKGFLQNIDFLEFSPDGKLLALRSSEPDNHGCSLRLWNVSTGHEMFALKSNYDCSQSFRSPTFSPDGKKLALAYDSRTMKLLDITNGRELYTFRRQSGSIVSLDFSPDGKRLASGNNNGEVRIWDVTSGQDILALDGFKNGSVIFSQDGNWLLSVNWDVFSRDFFQIKLWRAATKVEVLPRNY